VITRSKQLPLYNWKNKKTGKVIEVIRNFSDYQEPPTLEEAPEEKDPEWERMIGSDIKVIKGRSWGGSKGNWLILFAALPLFERVIVIGSMYG
jgi:predicted nucleic acid-binding Zn ribbon protein